MALVSRNNLSQEIRNRSTVFTKEVSGVCATFAVIVIVIFFIFSLLALTVQTEPPVINIIVVDPTGPSPFKTNSLFTSVALDSSVIADGFQSFKPKNPKLITLMSYLGPCYLRIGGTMADRLLFVPDGQPSFKSVPLNEIDGGVYAYENQRADPMVYPNFTMSGDEWLELNVLASRANMIIIFDLNCLIRHKNGTWNSKNAEELINFSAKHKLTVEWELGNEPNSFRHVFNYEVNATQLALDFIELRKILNKYKRYEKAFLVGPDVTRPRLNHKESTKYLKEFLKNVNHSINAITWHQYYLNGRTANLQDFLNPVVFNLLTDQIEEIKEIVKSTGCDNLPIWLGETSSTYGGGAPGYANRYVSTFIWLDKLGLAAKNGISLVIRQSIFKGYYALLKDTYEPTPDWWITILYKAFVGPEVVSCQTISQPKVRFYCHCTNKDDVYGVGNAITVFGFNMQESEAKIRIEGLTPTTNKFMPTMFGYVVTPHMTVISKLLHLNGEILYVKNDGELPTFQPFLIQKASFIVMPPFSLAFFVVPNTNVKACVDVKYLSTI